LPRVCRTPPHARKRNFRRHAGRDTFRFEAGRKLSRPTFGEADKFLLEIKLVFDETMLPDSDGV
jgi:hypothetical protein